MDPDHAVLLDIEGTTTSISFVFDVLFPYAARELESFLAGAHGRPDVTAACSGLLSQATAQEGELPEPAAVAAVVRRLMQGDSKSPPLKALQGLIWQAGYASGAIKGHVFADVAPSLRRWRDAGRPVAIYSSGSALAQQLLFRHSQDGDLSGYIAAHFDTGVGPKREPASYGLIAQALGRRPSTITFCTDQLLEAAAAKAAGMVVVVLMRSGNAPLVEGSTFPVHGDLSRI